MLSTKTACLGKQVHAPGLRSNALLITELTAEHMDGGRGL